VPTAPRLRNVVGLSPESDMDAHEDDRIGLPWSLIGHLRTLDDDFVARLRAVAGVVVNRPSVWPDR
jgi:hypothetical protein